MRDVAVEKENASSIDTGLHCLILVSQIFQVSVDPEEILHDLGHVDGYLSSDEILQAAKRLKYRARRAKFKLSRLGRAPLPVIAEMKDGTFVVINELEKGRLVIHDPKQNIPVKISEAEFEEKWSGHLILLATRASVEGVMRKFDLSWFVPELVRYRRLVKEVILATSFIYLLALVTPIIFQLVIDKVLVHHGLTTLHVLIIGLGVASAFELVLSALRNHVTAHTASKVDVALSSKLFNHLMALPISYFESHQAGQSVARVKELENVRGFLTGASLHLVLDAVFASSFLIIMWFYSQDLTLIVFGALIFFLLQSFIVTPILRKRIEEKFAQSAEKQTFLVEAVTGVETLKAMALEPQIQRRWEDQLAGYITANFRVLKLSNIINHITMFINKAMVIGLLWFGSQLVIAGTLTIGQLIAYVMLATLVTGPIIRLAQVWQDFLQLFVSVERLGDIMNMPAETEAASKGSTVKELEGSVAFENVSFRYGPNEPDVLTDINLQVEPGEVIGIAGPSGSGKSTLVKLLQRLHVPATGRILVDGLDVSLTNPRWLRRQIGVVFQENVLFNRSVRDNIAIANPSMDFDQVVSAAKLAGAHDFIMELPKAYDTLLVERGANLSGGQRQRVAIARALATDPKILIFDEATSSLDYVSEYILQQNLSDITEGRTVFIVSHRMTAIRRASRIITVEKGQITEQGTHKELMKNNGRYATLYKLQSYDDDV